MLSDKMKNQIALIAYATVSNLFAMGHNPRMRGQNFTWERFPDLAANMTGTQVFLNIPTSKNQNYQREIEEHARKTGREIAENLVRQMNE